MSRQFIITKIKDCNDEYKKEYPEFKDQLPIMITTDTVLKIRSNQPYHLEVQK